jgi:spore coat protein U-like protein
MKTRTMLRPLAVAAATLLPIAAWPATTTTTLAVNATVTTSCIVATAPVAFGAYDPTLVTATNGTGTVTVTCTNGTPYKVGLDQGAATGATVTSRKMANGANLLPYNLFRETGRTTNWGNTPSTDTVDKTASITPDAITVYGAIPPGATVPAGVYTDTVNVTVNY